MPSPACVTHVHQAHFISQIDTVLAILRDTELQWRAKCSKRSLARREALCALIAQLEGVTVPQALCQWAALAARRLYSDPSAATRAQAEAASMIKSRMKRLSFEHHLSLAGALMAELCALLGLGLGLGPGLAPTAAQPVCNGGRKLNPD
jgi:hypothetical protein